MRDHLISILQNARTISLGTDCTRITELAEAVEIDAMAALHGDKYLIPSELFGEITIPQDVITAMSNGDDDMWFSVGKHIDCNVFYADGWQWGIYPVNHEGTNTDHLIEKGKL